jgi:two-component system, cell cycle response regulator DivK
LKKIVIVDDDSDSNSLLEAFLQDNYEVVSYESATKALEELSKLSPNLIILDISLPDMNGVDLLKELRKQELFKKTPIIALTGYSLIGDEEKYLEEGFDDYISKPIQDFDKFIEKIGSLT